MSKPVVLFSGGRGTARVVEALLRCKSQGIIDVDLTLLVNAYDNGQSTGLVRRLFGILGPSDVRKTMKTLLDVSAQGGPAVADFFELRFGDEDDNDKGSEWPILEAMAQDHSEFLARFRKGQVFLGLSERHRELVRSGISAFLDVAASDRAGLDLGDLSLMNAVFAGLTGAGGDLQTAIDLFSSELPLRGRVLLNSPENVYLYAVREYRPNLNVPSVLDEADVVSLRSSVRIQSIYLLREPLSEEERTELSRLPQGEAQRVLQSRSAGIEGNPLARQALREADVILYGPGTQFSSLLPSYMTEGFGEAIAANAKARKILLCNIGEDYDIRGYTAPDIHHLTTSYLIVAQPVGRQPAGGHCGGPTSAIVPPTRADATAASRLSAGAPALPSAAVQSRRLSARARAITMPWPAKNSAAHGRAVTSASPVTADHRCKGSVAPCAVAPCGVCSSENCAGYAAGTCRAPRPTSPQTGRILKPLIWPWSSALVLLIIDELGLDKLEREEYPQAPSMLHKVIDSRTRKRSTALVTNIDFEGWGKYLGDPPIAMALLDRVVDGAIIHKFQGKSHRASRAQPAKPSGTASTVKRRPT